MLAATYKKPILTGFRTGGVSNLPGTLARTADAVRELIKSGKSMNVAMRELGFDPKKAPKSLLKALRRNPNKPSCPVKIHVPNTANPEIDLSKERLAPWMLSS